MPTYQYACTECGHAFEQAQSFSDSALIECPQCEGRLRKLFNAVGVVFKGSGFYRNDSRATSSSDAAESSSEKSSDTKSDKSDTKSNSKGDTKSDTKSDSPSTTKSSDSSSTSASSSSPTPAAS